MTFNTKWICITCNKPFLNCECLDVCGGIGRDNKYNSTDIMMAFLKWNPPLGNGGYCMKKIERDRRAYFFKHYKEPKKPKFKIYKWVIKKRKNGEKYIKKIYF